MIISWLIIAVSMALFLYWFRYTCVLILSTRTTKDYSEEVATANRLSFAVVHGMIRAAEDEHLDGIQASLERDYRLVQSLLKQAGAIRVQGEPIEEIMLRIDFRIMQAWCGLQRRVRGSGSRTALEEMAQIVAHFADTYGESASQNASA